MKDTAKLAIASAIGAILALILYTGILFVFNNNPSTVSNGVNEVLVGENVSIPAVISKTSPSVVQISRSSITGTALGSGVILDPTLGYVVTNYHVVQDSGDLTVNLLDGRVTRATRVGGDPDADIAVIQLEDKSGLTGMELGDSSTLKVGQMAIAIGSPLSLDFVNSVTVGVISALARDITVTSATGTEVILTVLQTDAAINPGNSGGALINTLGQLVGINSVKIAVPGVEGIGFAIPVNTLKPIVEEIIKTGKVTRPYLGVSGLTDISPAMAVYYNLPEGVLVGSVAKDSPAIRGGLRDNDIILKIGESEVKTAAELRNALFKQKPGDRILIEVSRGGSTLSFRVSLE